MKKIITILMILFITNNIQSQTKSKYETDNDMLIYILTNLTVYNYILDFASREYDKTIPGQFKSDDSFFNWCPFPKPTEIKDGCSLSDFFSSPIGESLILKRKIFEIENEIDDIYGHGYESSYEYAESTLKPKVTKYYERLKELGY